MSASAAIRIRPAHAADHGTFTRLFPELGTDDAIPDATRFHREMLATTWLAEVDGTVGGYVYFQQLSDTTYVRHLVTAPAHRRRGVGRALLEAVRRLPASRWCLNVKSDNAAAIALYESCGLREAHRSWPMRITWASLDATAPLEVTRIAVEDDADVTERFGLVPGLLADSRSKGRILVRTERCAAVFDPDFPGAHPFRCLVGADAPAFLAGLRRWKKEHDFVNVAIEGQAAVRDALVAVGGEVRFEIVHMSGVPSSAN